MNKCAFCEADKSNFRALPKTKHYELDDGTMVSTELSVIQCLSCEIRWIRYSEIEEAVKRK